MNKVILLGRLTRDPEVKTTANGISVCSFSVAVNRRFKNAEGGYDADFINCVAWRNTAEFIGKYFEKGRMIGLVGSIQTRTYEKEGQKHYVTEVSVDESYFADSKGSNSGGNSQFGGNTAVDTSFNVDDGFMPMPADDDLPF